MQGAVILYIAVFADGDMVQVAADDGAVPHAGAFGQGNIAEDGGIGCDKRGFLGIGVLFSQGTITVESNGDNISFDKEPASYNYMK